jgi:hypothetical protein
VVGISDAVIAIRSVCPKVGNRAAALSRSTPAIRAEGSLCEGRASRLSRKRVWRLLRTQPVQGRPGRSGNARDRSLPAWMNCARLLVLSGLSAKALDLEVLPAPRNHYKPGRITATTAALGHVQKNAPVYGCAVGSLIRLLAELLVPQLHGLG